MPNSASKTPLLVILGPTASGKTHIAVQVAAALNGEIISADSRQVYRKMDIGTGKDLAEYTLHGKHIPYHLIDILDAGQQYNVNDFQHDFENAYEQIAAKSHFPIVCGGTGFYILSLLKGHAYASIPGNELLRDELNEQPTDTLLERFETYNTPYQQVADTSTRKRLIRAIEISEYLQVNPTEGTEFIASPPVYDYIVFGLNPDVNVRRERISRRLQSRSENGMVEEVKSLLGSGLQPEQLIYYGLEYKYITLFLQGEMSYDEMVSRLETEIHRFAKRQMTYFRKMEKDGIVIHWLSDEYSEAEKIDQIVAGYQELCAALLRNK
ncbi:tRNA (adenosine(37)-N6)-dimethylallyltransferase MiaA [Dyadobacter sp. CY326]|uniref:tRNA (adenosine(37)-N6)-dimethylallyltransferase MiaA n=1 Tax=Dyadobacter sp. CY326 TaxID=2907300 RepID=UPI001F0320D2|nr:tRNA (adenosine(37)-N6)-dimethylallyltransferase MiaA [Dyadobacter sp. CY326]MCE7064883.1 tRNA (adenosine(37)-N6)-dimethylallyltransferase MiaA [Dyadobacter sp. CY326]